MSYYYAVKQVQMKKYSTQKCNHYQLSSNFNYGFKTVWPIADTALQRAIP